MLTLQSKNLTLFNFSMTQHIMTSGLCLTLNIKQEASSLNNYYDVSVHNSGAIAAYLVCM